MAEPAKKHQDIRAFQNQLLGVDVEEMIKADRCVSCKGPATQFNDEASRKEFTLSGLCQRCQDALFGPA